MDDSKTCLSGVEDKLLNEMADANEEDEHAEVCDESSVDADGTCLTCGAEDLI